MKAIIQRCLQAQVEVNGAVTGMIDKGFVIFLGVAQGDDESCAARLAKKVASLRIFDDAEGKFNYSLRDVGGQALVISNFTLCGDARKGTRPSFSKAASGEEANRLYQSFATLLEAEKIKVETGIFGATMQVSVINDGPVTMILEVESKPSNAVF